MAKRLTVVVSQGQSHSPAKRQLEENLITALILEPGMEVVVVPHLYDLKVDGTGILALRGIPGPIVVVSWLFERAARWILDRFDIRGDAGVTLIREEAEADEDDDELAAAKEAAAQEDAADSGDKLRVLDQRPATGRKIYCLDLRLRDRVEPFVEEIRRIAAEQRTQVVDVSSLLSGGPRPAALQRFMQPTNDTALPIVGADAGPASAPVVMIRPVGAEVPTMGAADGTLGQARRITEETERRWYPVIDYSRCTNCMECIDFCLFGVYGVDKVETILVEQPDNCRKGCPACSRVCPENAIIFPQHKSPAIAGSADVSSGGLKIDLSALFGAPQTNEDPLAVAARERDEQLLLAGRQAVGASVGMPKRQENKSAAPKDRLDDLIDALDNLDL